MERRRALLASLILLVTGCGGGGGLSLGTSSPRAPVEMPPELYSFALTYGIASLLSDACPNLTLNPAGIRAAEVALALELEGSGLTAQDIDRIARNLPEERIATDVFVYIGSANISLTEPGTYCRAGQREIARGTEIGALLT